MPANRRRRINRPQQMDLQSLEPIIVMLSSRNVDPIPYGRIARLSDVRSDCTTQIDATEVFRCPTI